MSINKMIVPYDEILAAREVISDIEFLYRKAQK